MVEVKSEVAVLREAIHALAKALELIPEIYVTQEGKAHGLESQIFSDLVKKALAKTSPQ
jgi:hypothetical protein